MKRILLLLGVGILLHSALAAQALQHPQKCGMQQMHEAMIANNPAYAAKLAEQKASLQAAAESYLQSRLNASEERTTSVSAVPVIFHIIVDSAQFNGLGGTTGIIRRCDSQIAVLNHDFNKQNADSTAIPAGWKSLFGNTGISFGLARKDPSGNCSPGYEIKIITATGFSNINSAFPEAKAAGTGLAAWDVSKYYNVWCINFTGSASSLLGITVPKSTVTAGWASASQEGVCILYKTLGSTGPTGSASGTGTWLPPYNLGRTLTHETGHFFEIWHTWGDDNGQCPTWSSTATVATTGLSASVGDNGITCSSGVGQDDGISDTPPESDAVYGNPSYTIAGGTTNDCCQMHGATDTQPIGIACLSYMDYTDDNAMHLFTPMQAAAMASGVVVSSGENYSLTQNPTLLIPCTTTGVAPSPTELNSSLSIYPTPSNGEINISLNSASETLNSITVFNLVGHQVMTINGQNKDYYSIDLSPMTKGIYFVIIII